MNKMFDVSVNDICGVYVYMLILVCKDVVFDCSVCNVVDLDEVVCVVDVLVCDGVVGICFNGIFGELLLLMFDEIMDFICVVVELVNG